MEGFWTVAFTGIAGWGTGVVTLIGGQLYGGDSGFLYTGTYVQQGNGLDCHVHVKRYAPGAGSVMGQEEFDLTLQGTMHGNTITVTGSVPGTPLQFKGSLTKQASLPSKP